MKPSATGKFGLKRVMVSALFAVVSTFLACSSISTSSDFDRKYNFKQLRVYEWLPVSQDDYIRHIDVERARRAVNKDLKFKGFRLATGDTDFLIAMSIGTRHRSTVVGEQGGWDRFSGGTGPQQTRTVNYGEGTIRLDFIDRKTRKIFWQGEAHAVLAKRPSPQKVEARINEAVGKMLRDFPPKQ